MLKEAVEIAVKTGDVQEQAQKVENPNGPWPLNNWDPQNTRNRGLVAVAAVASTDQLERILNASRQIGDAPVIKYARQSLRKAFELQAEGGGDRSVDLERVEEQAKVAQDLDEFEAKTAIGAAVAALTMHLSEWHARYRYSGGSVSFDVEGRARALAAVAPRLSTVQLATAVEEIGRIDEDQLVAGGLSVLAKYLPRDLLERALVISSGLGNEQYRTKALVALAPRIAELGDPARAMDLVRRMDGTFKELYQAEAIAGLSPHLPPHLLFEGVRIARLMLDTSARRMALAALDKRLPVVRTDELKALWDSTVSLAASRGRTNFLSDLEGLAQTQAALGPIEILSSILQAIDDAARWWP
jgi:hypothetical protein